MTGVRGDIYRAMGNTGEAPKPKYGLINKPEAHGCSPPFFTFFRGIRPDSVWRCKCGQVWVLRGDGSWLEINQADWEDAGGEL
jgi:hypothetical protein